MENGPYPNQHYSKRRRITLSSETVFGLAVFVHCIVTAGPTFEKMDQVRRLTNLSTGRLGVELANHLVDRGHVVTLLLGEGATYGGESRAQEIRRFSSTDSLIELFGSLSVQPMGAVLHAAAVSDFRFGKIWVRNHDGSLSELKGGKISTRQGMLMAELVPTPKVIVQLRGFFPSARIVGWKFEVEGNRESALRAAERQLTECLTDACVANGPAFGDGFGLVTKIGKCLPLADRVALFGALEEFIRK